jgi:endosialidase-like protein
MRRLALAAALLIASIAAALAQSTVTRIGPITPGACASFSSPNTIQDGGIPCGAGHFANPTGAVGLAVINGSATTALRSDAAPPLSASVQSALTAAANQLLVGTGAFGLAAIGAPTRAGDIAYFNGSTWVTLAGNNSGTLFLSENSSGVPAWSPGGGGSGANPTALVGLSPVNGVATTLLRSDGAPALDQSIVPTWTGTHTFSNATYSALFTGGNVGIGQSTPVAPLHIGSNSATTTGPGVLLSRPFTSASVGGHGFIDDTAVNLGFAGSGYNAYDAPFTTTGTQTYDHSVSFQSRHVYGSSGLMNSFFGFWDGSTFNGPVTNTNSFYAANPGGTGTVTNSYGFYSEALTKATTNYSFFTPFASVFNAASLALVTIGKSGTDYPGIGYNVLFGSTGGTYKYATSDFAPFMRFGSSGQIQTFTSVSGTAGNTISFTAGPFVAQGGTSWTTASDARLKENVQPIDVLARLDGFRAVSFDWKATGGHDVGVIAQEMENVFPELVVRGDPERLGVNYDRMGAMALGGVKQLMEKVKSLQDEVAALKAAAKSK